jgi:hypothetical protein
VLLEAKETLDYKAFRGQRVLKGKKESRVY